MRTYSYDPDPDYPPLDPPPWTPGTVVSVRVGGGRTYVRAAGPDGIEYRVPMVDLRPVRHVTEHPGPRAGRITA